MKTRKIIELFQGDKDEVQVLVNSFMNETAGTAERMGIDQDFELQMSHNGNEIAVMVIMTEKYSV